MDGVRGVKQLCAVEQWCWAVLIVYGLQIVLPVDIHSLYAQHTGYIERYCDGLNKHNTTHTCYHCCIDIDIASLSLCLSLN